MDGEGDEKGDKPQSNGKKSTDEDLGKAWSASRHYAIAFLSLFFFLYKFRLDFIF